MSAVFHMPIQSTKCGSHIHISPHRTEGFTLSEIKRIAFGIILYESLVVQLLPADRRENGYCLRNSQKSPILIRLFDEDGPSDGIRVIASHINKARSKRDIRIIMQGDEEENRHVLWNFANIEEDAKGSVEFRGGRALRVPVRTKRWIAFTIAFIELTLKKVGIVNHAQLPTIK